MGALPSIFMQGDGSSMLIPESTLVLIDWFFFFVQFEKFQSGIGFYDYFIDCKFSSDAQLMCCRIKGLVKWCMYKKQDQ